MCLIHDIILFNVYSINCKSRVWMLRQIHVFIIISKGIELIVTDLFYSVILCLRSSSRVEGLKNIHYTVTPCAGIRYVKSLKISVTNCPEAMNTSHIPYSYSSVLPTLCPRKNRDTSIAKRSIRISISKRNSARGRAKGTSMQREMGCPRMAGVGPRRQVQVEERESDYQQMAF